jgi:23S rRNA (guanine2445-N2)-methyltransferase / 23S rRNA (guanine2069-N7)-methyltransferase|tara:strand:+ start:2058 stop:4226 length:2169 start_codon:yes stop_codon:yes gene_type:complete
MHNQFKFFATTAKGMETLLSDELRKLDIKGIRETRSGVHFEDDLEAAYRVCLWSRIANRVLLPIADFSADSPEELYRGTGKVDWREHLDSNNTIAIDVNVANSNITHSHYAAQKTKDAIVDYFQELVGSRPSVQLERPDIRVNAYINRNEVQLSLDLSGDSLHRRGYRDEGSAAPLKENLAAAILMRAKWPEIASDGGGFVDFMCGSGTLPIEAAQIACDIAPGLLRDYYGFNRWKQHQPDTWAKLVSEAEARKQGGLVRPPKVLGFDHHRETIDKAQRHVRNAGLESVITIEYQDVYKFRRDSSQKGLVVVNPPYGKRLGQSDELNRLYHAIGDVLKRNFVNWKACVFTDNLNLGKQIGIRANKIHSLFNGALECKLLHFDVDADQFFSDARLPGFLSLDQLSDNAQMFRNRILKNDKRLARWRKNENIQCYRLYDADLPNYAVAVDLYEGEERWVHIQEYAAPQSIDSQKAKWRIREVITIMRELFDLDESQVFLKVRRRQRGKSQYEKLAAAENYHQVMEGNCRFLVNLEDYLDTGLFLDQRMTRTAIAAASRGKSFLNLFAYTGSATVHAAMGGAARTTSVDMSKTYLDWAQRNMALNGFSGNQHRYLQTDCLQWLRSPGRYDRYDIILLDPPTFSNSKNMRTTFDVQKDHPTIIHQAMKSLSEGGQLYFASNLRKFKLHEEKLATYDVSNITQRTIPPDFARRRNIHQCWVLAHRPK